MTTDGLEKQTPRAHDPADRPLVEAVYRRNERRFLLLWGATMAVMLAGLVLSAISEFRSTHSAAERAVADSALILKQHIHRHFEGADLILRSAAGEVSGQGWLDLDDEPEDLDLVILAESASWLTGLWLRDAAGTLHFASREPSGAVAESIAEVAEQAMAEPGRLVVGDPVDGTFTNWPSLIVGRAIAAPDGTVTGAAVLGISGIELADVFSRQALGMNGVVALVRSDGLLLARYPMSEKVGTRMKQGGIEPRLAQGMESATFRMISPVDGRDRIISFARVANLPLAAVAAYDVGDVRAQVLEALQPQYLLGGLVVIVLTAVYPVMMRRLRHERKAAQDLAERELLFRSILNNVGIGLNLVAADGTIRFANTGFDRMLGYEPGSLTGRNVEDLTHPDDRFATMYRLSRMESLGPSGLSYEKRYITRDGGDLETAVTFSLKPRVGDQEPLLVTVVQDLTDQRAREKAIAFQNSLLRIQQEASPDGILVTDADGRLHAWNRNFRDMWQVPEELLEQGEVVPVLGHIATCVAGGAREEGEDPGWLRRRLIDGRVIDTQDRELRDEAGLFFGHVWFFRDVTQRLAAETAVRESEARYRALVEQSPEAIVVYSGERLLFANKAARTLFGFDAETDDDVPVSAVQNVTDMVSPAVREQVREALRTSSTTPWNGIQEELQRRDGSLFDAWIISAPIRVKDEPAAQAVIRPLDAGQGVRGRLMQTAKMATLGQMAASVAHELSQPLNILSMGLEGIRLRQARGTATPEEIAEKLEMASRQCGRMAEIIDHIRVFSRSSKARCVPFDACGPVRAAVELMTPVFQREGLVLEVDAPDRAGVVEGNPLDLEQVIINLLKNAFDALLELRAEGGGDPGWVPAARVRVEPDAIGRHLTIEVSDTGEGIPDHLLQDIFEPFFTTKGEGVGTGLGLSICMNSITKMGGVLRAENRDGAVFIIRMPIAEDAGGVEGPGVMMGGAGAAPAAGGPTGHVLLVEPEAAARQALAVMLVEHGFRVSTSTSAAEAQAKARLDPPDVLVTAANLAGGEDGWSLIRRLRERNPRLPALALVEGAVPDDAGTPEATVFIKPLMAGTVVAAVREALAEAAA